MIIHNGVHNSLEQYHTGASFNTGTENTIQISKFQRIGLEKNDGFRWERIGL